ncbi:hypothetical protein LX36DRAFT_661640 [Colletotrichum falcatum]|nr:hypothetical protein LX36DRAFT_661640 [Colletotrichum falcatum]
MPDGQPPLLSAPMVIFAVLDTTGWAARILESLKRTIWAPCHLQSEGPPSSSRDVSDPGIGSTRTRRGRFTVWPLRPAQSVGARLGQEARL